MAVTKTPKSVKHPKMLKIIEKICQKKNISYSRFGRDSIKDPMLIADIKAGRELRRATIYRIFDYLRSIEEYDSPEFM